MTVDSLRGGGGGDCGGGGGGGGGGGRGGGGLGSWTAMMSIHRGNRSSNKPNQRKEIGTDTCHRRKEKREGRR